MKSVFILFFLYCVSLNEENENLKTEIKLIQRITFSACILFFFFFFSTQCSLFLFFAFGIIKNPRYTFRADSQRTPSMLTAVTQVDSNGRQIRTFRQSSYYRSISTGTGYKDNIGLLQTAGTSSSSTTVNVPIGTPSLLRKSASVKSPHPNQRALLNTFTGGTCTSSVQNKHAYSQRKMPAAAAVDTPQYHNYSTEIMQNDNSVSSCSSGAHSDDSSDRACLKTNGSDGYAGGGSGIRGGNNVNGGVSVVLSYDNPRGGVASMRRFSSTPLNGDENRNCLLTQMSGNSIGLQPLLSSIEDSVSSV